jgi:hypothetical protein
MLEMESSDQDGWVTKFGDGETLVMLLQHSLVRLVKKDIGA